jgi:hypothetical protein
MSSRAGLFVFGKMVQSMKETLQIISLKEMEPIQLKLSIMKEVFTMDIFMDKVC